MNKFESPDTLIFASEEKIFNFLSKFSNFENLMPEEISNWTASDDHCKFTIQGFLTLSMEITSRIPAHTVEMKSIGINIFDFFIKSYIKKKSQNQSIVKIVFEADLNPMMQMMASKTLENFVKKVAEQLKFEMEKN